MAKKKDKLWFEGQKTYDILFTEDDLRTVLLALEKQSGGFHHEDWNEFDKAKTRILFQMNKWK